VYPLARERTNARGQGGKGMKKRFRCCFKECKYNSQSLLLVFEHMEKEHKMKIIKEKEEVERE